MQFGTRITVQVQSPGFCISLLSAVLVRTCTRRLLVRLVYTCTRTCTVRTDTGEYCTSYAVRRTAVQPYSVLVQYARVRDDELTMYRSLLYCGRLQVDYEPY